MQQVSKELYRKLLLFSMDLQEQLPDVQDTLYTEQQLTELVDGYFAIRQSFEVLEDLLKHLRGLKTTCEKLICLKWAMTSGEPIRTTHVTASPGVVEMPKIPSRSSEPEAYADFMQALGCPRELLESDSLRPHWPGLVELFATMQAEGRPLPKGTESQLTYPVYSIKLLKKKGVLEE